MRFVTTQMPKSITLSALQKKAITNRQLSI